MNFLRRVKNSVPELNKRIHLLGVALLLSARLAFGGPVYEPIVGFQPTASSSGESLFHHSDGSFYGLSHRVLYRIDNTGPLRTFPFPGPTVFLNAGELAEASDGSLWAATMDDLWRFDPVDERVRQVGSSRPVYQATSPLASDGRGFLWGVALKGPPLGPGAVHTAGPGGIFKVDEQTGAVSVMHFFYETLETIARLVPVAPA